MKELIKSFTAILLTAIMLGVSATQVHAGVISGLGGPCGNIDGVIYTCDPDPTLKLVCTNKVCTLPNGDTKITDPNNPSTIIGTITNPNTSPEDKDQPDQWIGRYVLTLFNVAQFFGLVAVLIYIVYGGVKWITSGGDPKALQSARDTIIHACIGLILLSCVYAISKVMQTFVTTAPVLTDLNSHAVYVCGNGSRLEQCTQNGIPPAQCYQNIQCHKVYQRISNLQYSQLTQQYDHQYCFSPSECDAGCEDNANIKPNPVYKYCQPMP